MTTHKGDVTQSDTPGIRRVSVVTSWTVTNENRAQLPTQPTINQTAEYFGVDVKTVRRWIAQGRLTAYRIGPRLIRIDRESIIKLGSPIGGAA
jgi:excisionase family DNA binding protein